MNRRKFLAAALAAPIVGVGERKPVTAAPTPTPLDQLHDRYPYVAINQCPEGWHVWVGGDDGVTAGARAATIDEACRAILAEATR